MKLKVNAFVFLTLILSASFLFARDVSVQQAKQDVNKLTVREQTERHGLYEVVPMGEAQTLEQRAQNRLNYDQSRPNLTKEQLISAARLRNAIANGEEPSLSSISDKTAVSIIDEVPGGGDIFDTWHVSFDEEADFLTFELVDLLGNGNDWMWLDYSTFGDYPLDWNSAFAPEPGGDFGGDVEAKEEAIQTKVGIARESTGGDPYRVASLLVELYLGEPDYDGDGDGYLDDYLVLEILEEPKFHRDDYGSHTEGDSVWWVGETKWDTWGYGNRWLQYLDTNPIDLSGATAPQLTYQTAWSSEPEWDGGTVLVSDDDGATWTEVVPTGGFPSDYIYAWNYHWNGGTDTGIDFGVPTAGNHGGYTGNEGHVGDNWTAQTVDLTTFVGSTIIVRFAWASEGGYSPEDGDFDGSWWLDDINVDDGGDNLVTDLIPDHEGAGFTGDAPWEMLDYYYDTAGGVNVADSYNITSNVIGSFSDSLTVRFTAIFDDNDDQNAGPDPNWGFEVSDALLRVTTRFEQDAGASFVDLVSAGGDSVLSKYGHAIVDSTYDPVATIQNFGLTDINIYNTFVEIENGFGDLVYQEFIYTYAPGQGDTLFMYPGSQDFNDAEAFYNFPDWTPTYEGDYTLRAYFSVFGGDDEPLDDAIEVGFHTYETAPIFIEDFNAPTTEASLFTDGWEYESTQDDTSFFIGDLFGEGDTEIWWYSPDFESDSVDEIIVTPPQDLTGTTGNALSFAQYLNNTASSGPEGAWTLNILGRPDAETAWIVLNSVNGATAYALRYMDYRLDISAFDGDAAFQAGFQFKMSVLGDLDTTATGYATIDDVTIYSDADLTAPAAPTGLAATAGDLEVSLTWDAGGTDVLYYSLYTALYDDADSASAAVDVSGSETTGIVGDLDNDSTWYFFVSATDYNGNEGDLSASASAVPVDVAAPTAITDLAAVADGDVVTLTWRAPYESGVDADVTYDIRYSPALITDANFSVASAVPSSAVPAVAVSGTRQKAEVSLPAAAPGWDYSFAIKTTDEKDQVSALSNVAISDQTPPAQVTDLTVDATGVTATDTLILTWTSPGDDDTSGIAVSYDIRMLYSDTIDTWGAAMPLVVDIQPQIAGMTETLILDPVTYPVIFPQYDMAFALVATDNAGNESEVSNSAHFDPEVTASLASRDAIPTAFALRQNYPNPFNPLTQIEFALPEEADVVLTIYNLLGQEVKRLAEGRIAAGYHSVLWDATDSGQRHVPSGIYFYSIQAGSFNKTMKMVLLK